MRHKEKRAADLQSKHAKAAKVKQILKDPRPHTWSATQPAYAYTPACPDPKLRESPRGTRPTKVQKICLICRKKWPANCGQSNCDCEKQGHLYDMGEYYQPKVGGDNAVETR